jgi:NAD(P)H-flavin reductase
MASKPQRKQVDFQIRHLEEGEFTDSALTRLNAGDPFEVEFPLGSLAFTRRFHDLKKDAPSPT